MDPKPIIVGVDGSPESARAATMGAWIAERIGAPCRLVYAASDYWSALAVPEVGVDLTELDRAARLAARRLLDHSLEHAVSPQLRKSVEIEIGRPPMVLANIAKNADAAMVVMGGKRRRAIARIGGSSITHMVRLGAVPVLAVDGTVSTITRILVAVDLSYAAKPAIDAAEQWATAFGARLRVMHSVEPMPSMPGFTVTVAEDDLYRSAESLVESTIRPLVRYPEADVVVRRGRSAAAIASEAQQWRADLIIVGSHGKGWVDRMLIGSTSERLVQVLPAATLVVPVSNPAASFQAARAASLELAHAAL